MNEGKARVIASVLKQQGVFKAVTVVNATGLSRSLVHHHLTKLVEEGYLEKDGVKYCIIARADLLDSLAEINESSQKGLLPEGKRFYFDEANAQIETVVKMRAVKMDGYQELQRKTAYVLDDIINKCRAAKRHMNTAQMKEEKALEQLVKDFESHWKFMRNVVTSDKETAHKFLTEKYDRIDL